MKDYFFSGSQYIRVTRNDTGPGTVDHANDNRRSRIQKGLAMDRR
jgi:hypothetical protein